MIKLFLSVFILLVSNHLPAKELHVAKTGNDQNKGTFELPLLTIQAAADLAQPGDVITVHEGIYREEVKPPRSGTREKPITYLAAPGGQVSIRGSEQVTNWIREDNGLWLATLYNALFEAFNPFTTNVAGAWLQGSETSDNRLKYHLGDVYFKDEAFYEVFSIPECQARVNSWFTIQENGKTLLRANFGSANPNTDLTEINVRTTVIFPEISGLKYLVIDGFDIRHTASQWSDIYKLEEGAIGMKYGYGWVIENCTITNSRNNGISMGVSDEVSFSRTLAEGGDNIPPYGTFGFHIIRNNIIKRCGQCAIYGCYGAVGSVIENNEITETVYRKEWSGPNQADIKILFPIDVTIRNNKLYGPNGCGKAIWLDWGSQNARVTGNLIIDRSDGVFTEVSFGPTLIDNNIFIRSGIRDWSDGNIYAHNLFYQSPSFELRGVPDRPFVPYYKPHSTELAGRNETKLRHQRWYNNLFIGDSIAKMPRMGSKSSGFLVNNNVYLDQSPPFPFEGDQSLIERPKSNLEFEDHSKYAELSFQLGKVIFEHTFPLITSRMIGKMPLPQVFMEHPDGTPLDITTDYFGYPIDPNNVQPGPFQKILQGINQKTVWPNPGKINLSAKANEPVQFYVSLNGSDLNKGTIEQPLASLKAAAKAVRTLKEKIGKLTQPVEIILRAGTYYLEETLELKPEDSGTKEAPVTWRAAENEKVILSGGKPISGNWRKELDGKTWSIDLPQAKGWKRNVNEPEVYQNKPSGPWHFRQLFVQGKRAIRARFPNKNEQNPFLYAVDGSMEQVKLEEGKVKANWGEEPDAQINMVPNWRFFNQWNDVTGVDVEKSTIYFGPRERHAKVIKRNWFWIEGVKSELDVPGEWYLDPVNGRLYYMPEAGKNPNKLAFVAPQLNRIIYLKGDVNQGTQVEYVNFKDLELLHTTFTLGQIEARVHTDGSVMFENAQNCSIEDCHFENIGGYALWLHLDSQNNVFHQNTVLNSGGGGVLLTGSRLSYMDDSKVYTPGEAAAKVAPYLTRITHNTVRHCGQIRYYGGGVHIDSRPASMAMLPGNYIAHNHFQDLSRNGVFSFRNQGGNVVEFNEIHDCMQTTIDGASIHFASMNRFNAPNFILNNYLYDIWGFEQMPDGKPIRRLGNGVFLDWATSHTTVKNNVIYNTAGEEIKNIMGNWNLEIDNNLVSKTPIQAFFPQEIGPKGTATQFISPLKLKHTGGVVSSADVGLVKYTGSWEKETITGVWNLFTYNFLQAAPGKTAQCTYQLPVTESGWYDVCLMYFPGNQNASNAKMTVRDANGEQTLKWNFRKGDGLGFAVKVGKYYFEKEKPAEIILSNEDADGYIIADGVGFIKVD